MHPSQDFNRLYTDISESVATAIADISGLKVEHADGKQHIGNMLEKLRVIQSRFDEELSDLQSHAEWDKFTVAFFGETNAGKSTLIESMRILFSEEGRQQLLDENERDVARFEQALEKHVDTVREAFNAAYDEYAAEIAAIRRDTSDLSLVLREESSARMRRKQWLCAVAGLVVGIALTLPSVLFMRGLL